MAKEQREAIWNRFKEASTVINKRHQQHFEEIKKAESANLEQKQAICEQLEAIDLEALKGHAKWNEKTQEVLALQAQWKSIGFAPQKQNQKIFERYRAACDRFFAAKSEFFKGARQEQGENLARKIALCEEAEALSTSTDWKATADRLTEMQKEWRTIGPVAKKQSDAVWKRFSKACDAFFAARNEAVGSQRNEEQQNLQQKKGIVKELRELAERLANEGQDVHEEVNDRLHELMEQWNGIGHVPFRDKDKLFKQYRGVVDELFDNLRKNGRQLRSRASGVAAKAAQIPGKERDRLVQTYERVKQEIKTYENNLGFLTASSKNGNSLLTQMQQRMEQLKADAEGLLSKIKDLDEKEEKNEE